jgi:hypothetical protein
MSVPLKYQDLLRRATTMAASVARLRVEASFLRRRAHGSASSARRRATSAAAQGANLNRNSDCHRSES